MSSIPVGDWASKQRVLFLLNQELVSRAFPGGSVLKNWPANVGDVVSIPGPGRSHTPQSN